MNLGLMIRDNKVLVSSGNVAAAYGKQHKNVLRDIDLILEKHPELRGLNFEPTQYEDIQGKEQRSYDMDRQGFSILVNRFTGDKALDFTIRYTEAFEKMANSLHPQIDTQALSPTLQMFKTLLDNATAQEMKMKQLEESTANVNKQIENIKDTFIQEYDNWRDELNHLFNKIQKASGITFSDLRIKTYEDLENRARCDLSTRVRNLRDRLLNEGATKTKVNNVTKLDVIEVDVKLKEIYSQIIKEYAIKYVA